MSIDARRFVSGRGLLVTVVAAGVLAGGGAATAFAAHDTGDGTAPPSGGRGPGTSVTAAQAAAVALKAAPGKVEEIELDDDDRATPVWEIDLLADNGAWREVTVDPKTGTLLSNRTARPDDADDDDDGGRGPSAALRQAKLTASDAAGAAVKAVPGTVTSVDFEREHGRPAWEVDVTTSNGTEHELLIDATTAKILTNTTDDEDD
ncbi:MAG: PepSY domain-containing protein [Spirillospora sp.]